MSDHLPHFTCLDILSNQQKPPKYIIKEKHDEAPLLSFYNEIESCYVVCQEETPETREDQIKSL